MGSIILAGTRPRRQYPGGMSAQAPRPSSSPDCLFCRIVAGAIPAEMVATSERALAFRDIEPKAPLHVLVVPRDHHPTVSALAAADPLALAAVVLLADEVASSEAGGAYNLVVNTGAGAGQTVMHAHVHVTSGAVVSWSGS
jgi:histidine triad (HIT) family protein